MVEEDWGVGHPPPETAHWANNLAYFNLLNNKAQNKD